MRFYDQAKTKLEPNRRLKPRTFEDGFKYVPIWPPVRFKIAPKHQVTKFKKIYTPCNGLHSSGQYWQIFISTLRN